MSTDLEQLQTQLNMLYAQRAAIWDVASSEIRQSEANYRTRERTIQDRRFKDQHAIDAQIDTLLQQYTGRAGLQPGDVVRFVSDFYDGKRGTFALVQRIAEPPRENEAVLELELGVMTAPFHVLALVIDPDFRDTWKLKRLTQDLFIAAEYDYFDVPNCLNKVKQSQELIAQLIERLESASAVE